MAAAQRAEQIQPKRYDRPAQPKLRAVDVRSLESQQLEETKRATAARVSHASLVQSVALIFVCMAIGAVTVAGFERLTSASLEVDSLKKKIDSTQKRIDKLDIDLAYSTDLESIMNKATDEMNMVYPQKDQIVELSGISAKAPERMAMSEIPAANPDVESVTDGQVASSQPEMLEQAKSENTAVEPTAESGSPESAQTQGGDTSPGQAAAQTPAEKPQSDAPSYAAAPVRVAAEDGVGSGSANSILSSPQ